MNQFAWPWVPLRSKNLMLDGREENKENFLLKVLTDASEDEGEIDNDSLNDCRPL